MDKCLSIITNFGCHFTCPYCVVKNNHINVSPTTIESLDILSDVVKEKVLLEYPCPEVETLFMNTTNMPNITVVYSKYVTK